MTREDPAGWNEAMPAPPRNTSATSQEYVGAKPSDAMKIPATAGASVAKSGLRKRSDR